MRSCLCLCRSVVHAAPRTIGPLASPQPPTSEIDAQDGATALNHQGGSRHTKKVRCACGCALLCIPSPLLLPCNTFPWSNLPPLPTTAHNEKYPSDRRILLVLPANSHKPHKTEPGYCTAPARTFHVCSSTSSYTRHNTLFTRND